MVRPRKYKRKTEALCLSIDPDVLDVMKRIAKEHNLTVSESVTDMLKQITQNDYQFASMMAKNYGRKFYYWKAEKERLKSE